MTTKSQTAMKWLLGTYLLFPTIAVFVHADNDLPRRTTSGSSRRLGIADNVSQILQQEHSFGNQRPRFTLVAKKGNLNDEDHRNLDNDFFVEEEEDLELLVIQANPSVVNDVTTFSLYGGESFPVRSQDGVHFLVSDRYSQIGQDEDGVERAPPAFALLTVDMKTDKMAGIAQIKNGDQFIKVEQRSGAFTMYEEHEDSFDPPAWECGVSAQFKNGVDDDDSDGTSELNSFSEKTQIEDDVVIENADALFEKRRLREGHDNHSFHHHHHPNHDHLDVNEQIADKQNNSHYKHHLRGADIHSATDDIINNLGDKNLIRKIRKQIPMRQRNYDHERKLYATDAFPQMYTYQVDMYIEIDEQVIMNNGGMDNAIQYVNAVITAASAVYEREIDTHRE